MTDIVKGYIYATFALLTGGGFYIVSKFTTLQYGDLTDTINMAFWGFLGAFIASSPFYLSKAQTRKKIVTVSKDNSCVILGISFITAVAIGLYWHVLTLAEVGTIALLSQSNVLFSLILSLLFLGETINRKEMVYLMIVLLGFIVLSIHDPELSLLAFGLVLLVRLLYAFQSFIIKKFGKNIDGFVFGYVRTGLIVFFLGLFAGAQGKISFVSLGMFASASIAIIFGAILSKSCFFHAHKYLEVGRLNIFMLFQAVVTLIGSVIFFKEDLTYNKIIGTILIIGGLYFFTKLQLSKKAQLTKTKN